MEKAMRLIHCQFNRDEIEAGNYSRFVNSWGFQNLPQGAGLRSCLNRFAFRVRGYEDHPREIYEISEVRSFFRSLNQEWPFWFFVCNLSAPDLQTITLCCLPRLRILRRENAPFTHVEYDPGDLRGFVLKGFRGMNLLFDRAGMSKAENRQRSARIVEYFQTDWHTASSLSR